VMKSDTNLLFTNGGGHIEWTVSGPVAVQMRSTMDTNPKDGNVSEYEANQFIGKLDRWIEAHHIVYHGAKVLRCSLMNHQVTTDTEGLIAPVNGTAPMTINFIYDAAPADESGYYDMSDAVFVQAIFGAMETDTMVYRYLGAVELQHTNTIVGLETFILTSATIGHTTHYVLPIVDYYQYSLSYEGSESPKDTDTAEYRTFDPMTNTIVVLVILIILWVIILNAPKWFASHYSKRPVFGLRGGMFGLVAINFLLYVLAYRYWMLYILASVFLILSCVVGYVVYGRSKLAKDLEEEPEKAKKARTEGADEKEAVPEATQPGPVLAQAAPPSEEGAIDDFDVEEIFYIYKDGRVITHCSIKGCDSVIEKDLVGSMLVAIHEFVSSSFRKEGQLDGFQFGDSKIVVRTGNHGHLVIVLTGIEPPFLRDKMAETLQRIEGMYSGVIEDWDGDKTKFKGINAMIDPLFDLKGGCRIKSRPELVQVKSALEFYEGFLRLKIGIINDRSTSITDVAFRLSYDKTALRLSHVDPAYPMDGSTVMIGVIAPDEKKSIVFYLDPMTCQVTNIDGSATYRDFKGQFQTAMMKRRPAEIVCPIFLTPSTINVAMLKRLKEDLPYKDSRIFELGPKTDFRKVYSLAREAVLAHNVKLVKEFTTPEPFVAEAWFYGQTAENKEDMIIKVLSDSKAGVAQAWVASSNLGTQTGLISEVGNLLAKRMKDVLGLQAAPIPSTDQKLKDKVESGGLLLDAFQAEGEVPAADTSPSAGL